MASRDYKNAERPNVVRSRGESGSSHRRSIPRQQKSVARRNRFLVSGGLIGLAIGVALVVGTAFYLNRHDSPFTPATPTKPTEKPAEPVAILAPGLGATTANEPIVPPPTDQSASSSSPLTSAPPDGTQHVEASPPAQSPDYDFYKILPGLAEAVPGGQVKPVTDPPVDIEPENPVPPPTIPKKVYLQFGAFSRSDEADNLKAKLALNGIEAHIQTVELPDRGVLHRVRLGPFMKKNEAERSRAQLVNMGFAAVITQE